MLNIRATCLGTIQAAIDAAEVGDEVVTIVRNCTTADNTAGESGGGVFTENAENSVRVVNSIVHSSSAGINGNNIAGNGTVNVTYSNAEGSSPGAGNIDSDPMFIAPGKR